MLSYFTKQIECKFQFFSLLAFTCVRKCVFKAPKSLLKNL